MAKERLDKIIAGAGTLSRRDVKELVRAGRISVNGVPAVDAGQKADTDCDEICLDGKAITLKKHIYIMLNKPIGVVSASESGQEKTVVDLVPFTLRRNGLFPAGRLDKDTTGFVLITDDGAFAHRILSPKNHIEKTYAADLAAPLSDMDVCRLQEGIQLRDGTQLRPAQVRILTENRMQVEIRICEGKYHQIKRMLAAVGNRVERLERTHMGALALDANLPRGACRELSAAEIQQIEQNRAEQA